MIEMIEKPNPHICKDVNNMFYTRQEEQTPWFAYFVDYPKTKYFVSDEPVEIDAAYGFWRDGPEEGCNIYIQITTAKSDDIYLSEEDFSNDFEKGKDLFIKVCNEMTNYDYTNVIDELLRKYRIVK